MLTTKRKPTTVGEILVEEFLLSMELTQGALAEAMGVPRKHVNELCNDRRAVTAPAALILARVFGNGADFWLNPRQRCDVWEALHSAKEMARIQRTQRIAKPNGRNEHCPIMNRTIHRDNIVVRRETKSNYTML
jgi:addiction module HigA family antidote